jgi:tRNA(Arg) A34 adenosine deaminase TadA
MPHDPQALAARFLDVIDADIVPLTRAGVAAGDKLFGAAILRKADLSLVVAGTNQETENPLWHGEVSALNAYYRLPAGDRPTTRDCLFLSTHEPCSLCLSAITWAGFDNFTYLFGYEDTRDAFNIPHDLKILQEVFRIEAGDYARTNAFWTSRSIADLVAQSPEPARSRLAERCDTLAQTYADLSRTYQAGKGLADIPLS